MSTIQVDSYQNLAGQDWFAGANASTTGWQRLMGGLTFQWFRFASTWDGETERWLTLPIALDVVVAVMVGTDSAGGGRDSQFQLRNFYGRGFGSNDSEGTGYKITSIFLYQNSMAGAGGGQRPHVFVVGY